jgi:hypothetical protein
VCFFFPIQLGVDLTDDYLFSGFSARAGWDPITGLGTPNFALLKTAVGL